MNSKHLVKIRFNTMHKGSLHWRAVIDGNEQLADKVIIECPMETTEDILPSGETKYHITAYANHIYWLNNILMLS